MLHRAVASFDNSTKPRDMHVFEPQYRTCLYNQSIISSYL